MCASCNRLALIHTATIGEKKMTKYSYEMEEFDYLTKKFKFQIKNYGGLRESLYLTECGGFGTTIRNSKIGTIFRLKDGDFEILKNRFLDNLNAKIKRKQDEENQLLMIEQENDGRRHPLKVGDILVSTWGYEQTNVDFYQVVSFNGKTMVTIQQILSERNASDGFMTYTATPRVGEFVGEPMRRKVNAHGYINLSSFSGASKWNGKPINGSSYH